MSDWITYQDVLSSKFMLVRKSHVAPQYVEAFSIDNGRTEVMADTEAGVRAVLAQAIQTGTYRESGHVLAGPYFYKLRKNAGLNNSRHWINRVTAMLFPSGATADAAWVRAFQTSPNGSLASDYSVSIGNDVSQVTVPKWNDNIFPDGVCVSDVIANAARNKVPAHFSSIGRLPMKNIANPPELFKVFAIEEQQGAKVAKSATGAAPAAAGSPGGTFKI